MSNPTPSFQLGSGAGSRCAPSARSGLRSVSASNRPPVSSSPFAAMGSSTTNPSDSTSARNFAEISTAQDSSTGNLQRGAKRNEPDDVQGTNETLRAGHDSTQQHQLGHSSPGRQGREDDGRDRTLDQMEESMEAINQMRLTQQQHEERIQAILTQDPLRTPDASTPTTHPANRPSQSRRSTAARVFLGAEDQTSQQHPRHDRTTLPPHLATNFDILNPLETPGAARVTTGIGGPGTSESLRPRRFTPAKPSDLGLYEPDKGRDIFMAATVARRACAPSPKAPTLKEFRNRAFQAFVRDATLVQDDVDHRKFKPHEESLETYLSDKYKLVSELQVAKAIAAGHTDFDNPKPEAARILMTVKDAIQTVHNGLPADWRTLLNVYRQEDWPTYRSQLLGNERQTREAIAVFSGNQQASKAKEEDTQASVKFDTANQSNGWKANQGTRIYGQPTPASSDTSARKKDREEHLCYHCHEPGHFKFECPRRDEDIKHVRAILATMEDNDHRNIDASVVKKVRVAMDQSSRPGSSGGDGLVRVARGTHITRDDIDEPARVVHARKAYVSSDVDNSPPLSPIHWKYGGPTITASYNAGYESDSDSD
ncbi:unnamed protein product [Tilletia controversa]|uniref:CCHC-type domain-containing protein n=1 Tax=Tilletia controversa TaxID=13291 RepID=A0A8X7MKK5_9BASI|nr:hypothetical protein CF335_g8320 [Tilletia laevis]KAE8239356.1 hypothetical protein A4X06_0g8313 [Tilletia controversa]CAD6891297.1 unnamed protein product [Tilletia caries]CAD6932512.1 unnamed protein product [Tilletia controversa]CAD6933766.1 unnamed protein product [Tilletia controversa]